MHNHVADGLSRINPTWNDNKLFNEARKIMIAKYQHVIYKEVVPALLGRCLSSRRKESALCATQKLLNFQFSFLGPTLSAEYGLLPKTSGFADGYNPKVNGQTLASFASAAGRILHSLIRGSARYFFIFFLPQQSQNF